MLPTDYHIRESFSEGLTQSEIMERCNCPRKHMFRYILNLKRQGSFSWALLTGGAVHKLLEEHYKLLKETGTGLTQPKTLEFDFEPDVILEPNQYEEYKYWQIIAGMLVYRHNIFYQETDSKIHIDNVEVPVDLEYRGFRLRGMIDLVGTDSTRGTRPWIMDHKTASDINDIRLEGWQFRFQFLFYSWLWTKLTGERPSGNYVNILKKPQERRSLKRGETIEDFCRRIDFNINVNPHEYFRREWIPFDDGMIERFQKYTLDPILTQFNLLKEIPDCEYDQELRESLLLVPNTDHCISWNVKCEFLELCKNNFQDYAVEYIHRPIKHPELRTINIG
jgi:PD-(D/E)XK nuclease superfamily protein